MASRAYYLQLAKNQFDMAAMARDRAMRDRWIERANEYLILADALGIDEPAQDQEQEQSRTGKDDQGSRAP